MRKIRILMLVVLALLAFSSVVSARAGESKTFVAPLSGAQEVPARDTLARGNAIFHVNADGTIEYKLIVANINNVVASHIHCGAEGDNGPVGVNLYVGGVPGSGRYDGILASGVITAPNPGNPCGWTSAQDVIDAMLSGDAYVNVHTNDGLVGNNTGPGDFAAGEIRGQIFEAGPSK